MPRVPLFVWLVVAGLAVCWIGLGSLMLPGARAGDFLNLYTGARLALEGNFADLHNVDVQLERERRILPGLPALLPFVRPPFYALLLAPLAMLPYGTAFICWITVQVLLLCGCMAWALKRFGPDALVFGMLYLPPPLGIASGQDCVEMLVLFILAYELTQRHKPFTAGAALAVMLFKFHLILLWPLALLVQRRWRMLGGFCAMAAGEIGLSLWLSGMRGTTTYVALLRNKSLDHLAPSPQLMISYQGMLANLDIQAPWAVYALIAAVVLIFLWVARTAPLWRLFALTALASLFIAPHVYAYDGTLLLLPIWLIIFTSVQPATRIAATLFSTPMPFGFALAGKPYAIVASASMLALLLLVASETIQERRTQTLHSS